MARKPADIRLDRIEELLIQRAPTATHEEAELNDLLIKELRSIRSDMRALDKRTGAFSCVG